MAAKKASKKHPTTPAARQPPTPDPPDASPDEQDLSFPIVGIGASAGGLDAFRRFFAALPPDSGMAFVLVPHLDPSHRSLMVELLGRETTMTVREAGDGMQTRPNWVYVIPPDRGLSLSRGCLHLTDPAVHQDFQTSLNSFFRSLAKDRQERAIGIVFSGTGTHGTPGLKEIKAAGGMIMAQDPETAEYDQMPRSAIETGLIDFVLAPEEMPGALIRYVRQPWLQSAKPLPVAKAEAEQIAPVLELLRTRGRCDFRCYRKNMLHRRILRRMGICGIDAISDYVAYLGEHAEEVAALGRDLLIGVTSFFRDPGGFQVVEQQVIPKLVERQSGEVPIRVWVPACATGEEAYSLAILLLEQFAAARKPANVQIFASDIDEESLEVARRGVYPASALSELSPQRVAEFFLKTDENHYQVTKQLRGVLVVTRQNLISDAPFSKLDLISCRNLLIYLEPELQQKVLSLFHFALNERGVLFLGCSESIGRQTDLFEPISKPWRVFRRIGAVRHDLVHIPIMGDEVRRLRISRNEPIPTRRTGFSDVMQKLLLARFAPAAALINRKYEVLSLSGKTSDYLELPDGELTRNLLSLVRPGLRTRIRAACQKVLVGGEPLAAVEARVRRNGGSVICTITVGLVQEPKDATGMLLVTFQDRASQPPSGPALVSDEESAVVRQLESEVESTRGDLQSSIEELQSSNEEVMSMNEELQSANEELETSKEELQSFNEELSTVNSQLQAKIDELERANNDIRNLLISTEIATVFLDTELLIRRFTPATAQLLHLLETDIGRPIRDFALRFTDQTLLRDVGRVLDQLTPVETEIRSEEGRWYLRRILPYRTADNQIEGVAVTFVDITGRMQSEAQARRLATVLRDSNDAILLLDFDGRITSWNSGAEQLYGYTEAEALALTIGDLVPEDERAGREQLLRAVARGEELQSFEARGITKGGRLLDVWSTITPLTDARGQPTEVAMTSRDITERKRSEVALAASERRLRAILDTAADGIVTIDEQGVIESFNPTAERMFGYSRDEAIGRNVKMLLPEPYRELSDADLSRYLEAGSFWNPGTSREFVGQRRDSSTFPLELAVSELHDGPHRSFTGLIRDISERKALQRELLSIAAEEQRRIGEDLHDSVGQKLTGLGMLAGSLASTLSDHSPVEAKAADRIALGMKGVLEQIRGLSRGLLGVEVDPEGLSAALAELAETTSQESGVPCDFNCPTPVLVENNETATQLYRIAQEAVANALKHGSPRHVEISLHREDSQLVLSIRDNGKGIASDAWRARGMGLKIMQHRAALIGASLSVVPVKKAGSLVTCRLFENRKHDKSQRSTG